MNSEDIMLSEVSQKQKDKNCMILVSEVPRVIKLIKTEGRMVGARSWREERTGSYCFNWHRVVVWEDEKVLQMDGGDGCAKT